MEGDSALEDFPVTKETIKLICELIENDALTVYNWMHFIRRLDNLTLADIHNLEEKKRNGESIRVIIAQTLELWISKGNATFQRFLHLLGEQQMFYLRDKLSDAYEQIKMATLLGIKDEKVLSNVNSAAALGGEVHQTAIIWNVPPKNSNFIGRSDVLEKLNLYFSDSPDYALLGIIYGLGGIGKSSTALEYVWTNRSKYRRICWFHAESKQMLIADYITLAQSLLPDLVTGLGANQDQDKLIQLLMAWFVHPKNSGWLLVYDYCSTYDEIVDMLPVSGGHILISSRNSIWQEGKTFQLHNFEMAETATYVRRILGEEVVMSEIEALGVVFDHLPLAIAQACAYILCSTMTIPEYIKAYSKAKVKWLSKNSLPKNYNVSSVLVTWKMSIDKIQQELPLAVRWLEIMSCLDGDRIPHELLKTFVAWNNNNVGEESADDDVCREVLLALAKFSMISVDTEGKFSTIHRLVQEVINLTQDEGCRKEVCVIAFFILSSAAAPMVFIELPESDFTEDDLQSQWSSHWAALLVIAQEIRAKEPMNSITLEFTNIGIKPPKCQVESVSIEIQFLVKILLILSSKADECKTLGGLGAEIPQDERRYLLQQLVELWNPVFGEKSLVVANCYWDFSRVINASEQIVDELEDYIRIYSAEYNEEFSTRLFHLMSALANLYITQKQLNKFHKGIEALANARQYFERWNELSTSSLLTIRDLLNPSVQVISESKSEFGKELANSLHLSLQNIESCSGLAYTILILAIEIENRTPILLETLIGASASTAEPGQENKKFCDTITSLTSGQRWNLSPLFYATLCNCNQAIKTLIMDYGVDPAFQNVGGETVLHYSSFCSRTLCRLSGCEEGSTFTLLLECLLQKFESSTNSNLISILNSGNIYGASPLTYIVLQGNEFMLRTLLEKCGSILELDKGDNRKQTPLAIAIQKRTEIGMVKLLLEAGSSPTAFDDHDSILHKAVQCCNEEILILVLEAIRKVSKTEAELEQNFNPPDAEGDTPLMWAAEAGKLSQVRLLLKEKEVKKDLKNSNGLTAMDWAIKKGYSEIVELLVPVVRELESIAIISENSVIYSAEFIRKPDSE